MTTKDIVEIEKIEKIDNTYCSCIKTARRLGIAIPYNTNASDFIPNTTPHVGALVLFKFTNDIYHVAYIDKITNDGLFILQGNKEKCKYTEEWISWDNPYLIGFWKSI